MARITGQSKGASGFRHLISNVVSALPPQLSALMSSVSPFKEKNYSDTCYSIRMQWGQHYHNRGERLGSSPETRTVEISSQRVV